MIPTPNTDLYLLTNVELDPDYNYTIDFDSATAQQTYFQSKISNKLLINEDYSFVRADESLKIQAGIEDLNGVNYLMFKNDNKWHYCFIVKKQYVSPVVTKLIIKYDVYQTFMFDFELSESFIDREHQDRYTSNGFPIFNTQEENLNIGKKYELKNLQSVKNNDILRTDLTDGTEEEWQDGYIVMITAEKMNGDATPDTITVGNFIETPYYIYAFPFVDLIRKKDGQIINRSFAPRVNRNVQLKEGNTTVVMTEFGNIMKCEELKASKKVLAMYYTPKIQQVTKIENDTGIPTFTVQNIQTLKLTRGTTTFNAPCIRLFYGQNNGKFLPVLLDFDMYTGITHISYNATRDKKLETKLFTNPYFYFQLDNQQTEPLTFFNEFLKSYEINVKCSSIDSIQPKWAFSIENYLNDNFAEKMIDNSIVDLPLMSDAYLEYMTQNKASATSGLAIAGLQTIASIGLGAVTGGLGVALAGGQALSFAGQVANEMIKREDLKQTPDTIKNAGNNGLFTLSSHFEGLNIKTFSIMEEYQDKIYSYFFHYGYKCNDFKKPNTRSRYWFNFIRTIGANIKTNIDAEYKNEIASIFDRGITIWHYRGTNFKGVNNYNFENAEMSLI